MVYIVHGGLWREERGEGLGDGVHSSWGTVEGGKGERG